jgi:hypothetical protein
MPINFSIEEKNDISEFPMLNFIQTEDSVYIAFISTGNSVVLNKAEIRMNGISSESIASNDEIKSKTIASPLNLNSKIYNFVFPKNSISEKIEITALAKLANKNRNKEEQNSLPIDLYQWTSTFK